MKKRIISALALAGILTLTACGNSKTEEAPKGEKVYKVGVIQFMDHVSLDHAREGFEDALKDSGLNVKIDVQNENGDMSLTTQIPKKFEGDKVDLIYAIATPSAQGAKNMVKDIPIVFSSVTDPVKAGLVDSVEKPGGNITGASDYISPKAQIEEFLKLYPDTKTFGVIYNTSEPNSQVQLEELEKVLKELNLDLRPVGVTTTNDVAQAAASLKGKVDALFALTDNTVANAVSVVAATLNENKIPSLSAEEGQVANGLLMSQGISYYEQGRLAGEIAIRILKGEKAGDIPVAYHDEIIKKINKNTAEILGLDLNDEFFQNAEIIGK